MRKLILTALVTATVIPTVAQAQYRDTQRDHREIRQDRRELRQDRRDDSSNREIRGDRRELREDRADLRQDQNRHWGNDDWRGWRDRNRGIYARGTWRAPFRYTAFRAGVRIAPAYYGSSYWIADPWRYRLPQPGYGQRWVRHYDDLLLVDTRRGYVIRVINHFYW